MLRRRLGVVAGAVIGLTLLSGSAMAQVVTATVSGTVKDSQGAVIPGANVTLISDTRGTQVAQAVTGQAGDYVFPNVPADTYTVQVSLQGFKTLKRPGIAVSPGDRVAVPMLTIEVGALTETVEVKGEARLVQATSGERSFTIATSQVENLPVQSRNFATLALLTPGVTTGTYGQPAGRIGGGGYTNIMMDGISVMDTGNNGQMLSMNVDAVAEVKVLTSAYQAEYGRSSGLQITTVTKSGTNKFRGSVYDVKRNSDWNANSWYNKQLGVAKTVSKQSDWGYTIGGPVGNPGGSNRLFFFYSQEFRPRTGGNALRQVRVPTDLERAGDFSQTRDNNGALYNLIKDPLSPLPCTATSTAGCFQDGGVVGRIPANRLYQPGINILKLYPPANIAQAVGTSYNYQFMSPVVDTLSYQPAVRLDYQVSNSLRASFRYNGQNSNSGVRNQYNSPEIDGLMNTKGNQTPWIHTLSATLNYNLGSKTYFEATYGMAKNALSSALTADKSNRLTAGLGDLPFIYPDANIVDPRYYSYNTLSNIVAPWFVDGRIQLPPSFNWGSRIGSAPPNLAYPSYFNINHTQDFTASLTRLMGRHMVKTGFYLNHSFKAQNLYPSGGGLSPQGILTFANDTNNPYDTGFGFANAAIGSFQTYAQAGKFIEADLVYTQLEGYIQDNWHVNNRLTLDYGLRLTNQGEEYDKLMQASNFFMDQWVASQAPLQYLPGCVGGKNPCSGNNRQAYNPVTGQLLGLGSTALIGQVIPGTGNLMNGVKQQGQGISDHNYEWPNLSFAPRIGAAYDLRGDQKTILRGAFGLFFDRPDGNNTMGQSGNPPATGTTLRYGQLQTLGAAGAASAPVPTLSIYRYKNDGLPTTAQWNVGLQMVIPLGMTFDAAYVGLHGYNLLNNEMAVGRTNLNAVDFGAAYLAQNQDPTLPASTVPGATAYTSDLLRAFKGYSSILQVTQDFWRTFHGLQFSVQRRFAKGWSAGFNWNLTLSDKGTYTVQQRLQHNADGTVTLRADQAEYNKLMEQQGSDDGGGGSAGGNRRTHIIRGNFVWQLPKLSQSSGTTKVLGYVLNDWQLSGVFNAQSGARYSIGYSYVSNGASVNLTGSPDYAARIRLAGDPGSGCSSNQYVQFNTAAFAGPTYGSVGMESGRNYMTGCWENTWDLAISRSIRLGGNRSLQFRLEAYNTFNTTYWTSRSTTLQMSDPVNQTVLNSQYNADGTFNQARLKPNNAGFGAATGTNSPRTLQAQIRFAF